MKQSVITCKQCNSSYKKIKKNVQINYQNKQFNITWLQDIRPIYKCVQKNMKLK